MTSSHFTLALLAICALLVVAQRPRDHELDETRVSPPASFSLTLMGYSVRADKTTDNRMIVGSLQAPSGKPAAFIYIRNVNSLDWTLEAVLEPPAGDDHQGSFGEVVAIEGSFAAVSSVLAVGTGAVYIYSLSNSWTLAHRFVGQNGSRSYGSDLSICNKKLLVAANRVSTRAVTSDYFLHDLTTLGAAPTVLPPLAPITFAHYSRALALSPTHAFISYPSGSQSAPSYLFIYNLADISQTQVIFAPDIFLFSLLSASTTSDLLVSTDTYHEAVFVYAMSSGQWAQEATITSPEGPYVTFATSIAIEDDRLLIGAPTATGLYSGSAYLYQRYPTGWSSPIKIGSTRGMSYDSYGHSVALGPHTAFVGVFGASCTLPVCKELVTGSVHVYNQSNSCGTNSLTLDVTLYYFTSATVTAPVNVSVPFVVVGNLSIQAPITVNTTRVPITVVGCLEIAQIPINVILNSDPVNASVPLARTDCINGEFGNVSLSHHGGCKRYTSSDQVYNAATSTLSVTLSVDNRCGKSRRVKLIAGLIGGFVLLALIIGVVVYLGHVKRLFRGLDVLYRTNDEMDSQGYSKF